MASKRSSERFFTEREVAELLRVDVGAVQILRRTGRLRARRHGSSIMVSESDLASYYRRYRGVSLPPSAAAMSRRKVLCLGALAAELIALSAFYESVRLVRIDRPRADREADEYFGGMFGRISREKTFDYSMGRQRYSGPLAHHPDNWAAGVRLSPAIGLGNVTPQQYRLRNGGPLQLGGDLFIFGGSNSTEETAVAWEFEGEDDQHLTRRVAPLIPLRWWGVSDPQHPAVCDAEPVAFYMEGAGPRSAPGWPLIDGLTKDVTGTPITYKHDTIIVNDKRVKLVQSNFVLLTRLPNYLDPQFPEVADKPTEWPHMLVVEGGNGIGTRAAELLASSAGLNALHDASVALADAREFQVLFEAFDVDLDLRDFHRFRSIRYVASHKLPRTAPYLAASEYAKRRLESPTPWLDDAIG